jgi:glycosyltransferase involved in cell wall biosynthesis
MRRAWGDWLNIRSSLPPSIQRVPVKLPEESHCIGQNHAPVIWFEVEDFLRYFDHFRNPTGLQRVPFEIYLEADGLYGLSGRVRFCRLSLYTKQIRVTNFKVIRAAYLNPLGARAPWKKLWEPARLGRELSSMLWIILRNPRFFFSLLKTAADDFVSMGFRRHRFSSFVRPGDILVSLGAPWGVPHYAKHIAEAKRRYGIKHAILIHDLIPIEYESFVEQQHVVQFRNWLQDVLTVSDVVLTISEYSRDVLVRLAEAVGWSLPRVEVIKPGSGLSDGLIERSQTTTRFPPRYVLYVSTIEIRKNHQLLVNVWRRLLKQYGVDLVPTLLFVGKVGWLIDELLADLAASNYLDGKIMLVSDLSDAELCECYRSCLFTVFSSLCEGWGLPIAESLAQGKFCVASNRTSIPEVGGDLIDYFDPKNEDDAYAKIERLLLDSVYLTEREAQLRTEYRPRTWTDCLHALVATLDQTRSFVKAAKIPGVTVPQSVLATAGELIE